MKTIDLDLAEELQSLCKEKNITMPESELVWMPYKDIVVGRKGTHRHYFNPAFISENYRDLIKDDWHKAYTLDELMEWLPLSIYTERLRLLNLDKGNDGYGIGYGYEFDSGVFVEENPANAACKLLIWLIKEGLI
jgi:hypothetical protein